MTAHAAGPGPVVLLLAQHYLPSERAGGGLRTIVNMVERLGNRFEFRVVTTDRDLGEPEPFDSISIGRWNQVGRAQVLYAPLWRLGLRRLRRLLREVDPDVVYMNSVFSPLAVRYLLLRRVGLGGRAAAIIAPEGELAPDPLRKSPVKKRVFRLFARATGLHRGIEWKAAAAQEAEAVRRLIPGSRRITVVPNMPPLPEHLLYRGAAVEKRSGELRVVFLARVVPIKNLKFALELLGDLEGSVCFDIYGPMEDEAYWRECERVVAALPANVRIRYQGVLPASRVTETLARYHFMLLPTLGENFGHVIIEALGAHTRDHKRPNSVAGTEAGPAGLDLPLENPEAWQAVLKACVALGQEEYAALSRSAQRYAGSWLRQPALEADAAALLTHAAERAPGSA